MKRKRTRSCIKSNKIKMPKKASKVKAIVKPLTVSSVSKVEKKTYCLFCYKLVNYNINSLPCEPNQDKENEIVETCDKFKNYLLLSNSNYVDNSRSKGKDATRKNKNSSFSFKQIQQMCLGACNDCFYVINMSCTIFKEIEDLQSSLKTSLKTLRSVMHEAGRVTARMKLFRDSFALATAHKKKGKRKRKFNTGPKKSLQEVLEFRQSIFETCALDLNINGGVKNGNSEIQLNVDVTPKPNDRDQLSDTKTRKQSSTVELLNPVATSTSTNNSTTNDESVEPAEDKDNEDSDIEILNVVKTEVEEMTLDLHPSFYTEDNLMNENDENAITALMNITEGRSESIFQFKCIKCEKTFSTEDQLISHAASHFYTEVNIQTTDDSHVKNYISSNHLIINYNGNDSTAMPVESDEENEELLSCIFCSFTTDKLAILVEHETTLHIPTLIGGTEPENNDGKEVRCPRCLNSFSLKNKTMKLRQHYMNCHLEKKCTAKCESCNAVFEGCNMKVVNVKLNLHYQRIHTTGRTRKFACKICDKRFYYGYYLKNHMMTHTNEKFKCSICQVNLSSKQSHKRHMISHTNEKFKCSICQVKLSSRQSRKRHMKKVHKQND